jgi:hypothetical protein
MKQFASTLLGVAVGAAVAYLAIPEQPVQPPTLPAQQQAYADANRLAELRRGSRQWRCSAQRHDLLTWVQ